MDVAAADNALCYVFVFPAVVVLRRKYPYAPQPYRVRQGRGGPGSLRAMAAPSSAREDTPSLR